MELQIAAMLKTLKIVEILHAQKLKTIVGVVNITQFNFVNKLKRLKTQTIQPFDISGVCVYYFTPYSIK